MLTIDFKIYSYFLRDFKHFPQYFFIIDSFDFIFFHNEIDDILEDYLTN